MFITANLWILQKRVSFCKFRIQVPSNRGQIPWIGFPKSMEEKTLLTSNNARSKFDGSATCIFSCMIVRRVSKHPLKSEIVCILSLSSLIPANKLEVADKTAQYKFYKAFECSRLAKQLLYHFLSSTAAGKMKTVILTNF